MEIGKSDHSFICVRKPTITMCVLIGKSFFLINFYFHLLKAQTLKFYSTLFRDDYEKSHELSHNVVIRLTYIMLLKWKIGKNRRCFRFSLVVRKSIHKYKYLVSFVHKLGTFSLWH